MLQLAHEIPDDPVQLVSSVSNVPSSMNSGSDYGFHEEAHEVDEVNLRSVGKFAFKKVQF